MPLMNGKSKRGPAGGGNAPKYAIVEQKIIDRIRDGELQVGDRLPGEVAISDEFGFARMTVRRAIERLVDQGVLEKKRGQGAFVREQSLSLANAGFLALHSPIDSQYLMLSNIVETLRERAKDHSRDVRVMIIADRKPSASEIVPQLRALNIGALGMDGFYTDDRDFVRAISQLIPCVLFNNDIPGLNLPCAQPNVARAAELAVDYLQERGRRRVGFIRPFINYTIHNEFASMVAAELNRRGIPVDRANWYTGDSELNREKFTAWARPLLDKPDQPDAFISCSITYANIIHNEAEKRNMSPGRDIDIIARISGENEFAGNYRRFKWPCIIWNHQDIARAASDMLLQLLEGNLDHDSAPVYMAEPRLFIPNGEEIT